VCIFSRLVSSLSWTSFPRQVASHKWPIHVHVTLKTNQTNKQSRYKVIYLCWRDVKHQSSKRGNKRPAFLWILFVYLFIKYVCYESCYWFDLKARVKLWLRLKTGCPVLRKESTRQCTISLMVGNLFLLTLSFFNIFIMLKVYLFISKIKREHQREYVQFKIAIWIMFFSKPFTITRASIYLIFLIGVFNMSCSILKSTIIYNAVLINLIPQYRLCVLHSCSVSPIIVD